MKAEYDREKDDNPDGPWPEGEGRCTGCGEIISASLHAPTRCAECLAGDADAREDR